MTWVKDIWDFAFKTNTTALEEIKSPEDYLKQFEGDGVDNTPLLKNAFEKAWDARKFEIDNYWKRTTYFWAFQVTSFAAYFAILNSDSYNQVPRKNPEILYCSIGLGLITSLAWVLINIGSKFWQRHWEKHIDMLEDKITGPIYKTVYAYKNTSTFSVSKINDIISRFFTLTWGILGVKYYVDNLCLHGQFKDTAFIEIFVTIGIIYFILAMFKGHGRGSFGGSEFSFYRRKVFK